MQQLNQVKEKLEKRGFPTHVFQTAQEAKEYLLEAIAPTQSVAVGGSASLQSIGIADALVARGNRFICQWDVTPEKKEQIHAEAAVADVYLTSANALVTDGRLINVDGHGNRAAATLHGPGKVIFVVGKNKLADSYDAAIQRIKTVACPANARRLGINTPCAKLGYCTDCSSPQRMCNGTLILEHCTSSHPMEVVLVNEDLGY